MADMERFDEQIADERVETNEINLQNQRNNQFHEGMNRDWETRMREMKQELQRIVSENVLFSKLMNEIKYEQMFIVGGNPTESEPKRLLC